MPAFVDKTRSESGCAHDVFSYNGEAHCREGCDNAAAVLAHLDGVGALLRKPLASLNPQWLVLEPGGLRR